MPINHEGRPPAARDLDSVRLLTYVLRTGAVFAPQMQTRIRTQTSGLRRKAEEILGADASVVGREERTSVPGPSFGGSSYFETISSSAETTAAIGEVGRRSPFGPVNIGGFRGFFLGIRDSTITRSECPFSPNIRGIRTSEPRSARLGSVPPASELARWTSTRPQRSDQLGPTSATDRPRNPEPLAGKDRRDRK